MGNNRQLAFIRLIVLIRKLTPGFFKPNNLNIYDINAMVRRHDQRLWKEKAKDIVDCVDRALARDLRSL